MNVSGTESNQKNQEPAEGNDDHTNFLFDQRRPESRHQGPGRTLGATATTKSTDKIELESDKQGPEQNQKPSNTKAQEKDLGETNLAKQPLLSLYEQTTDAYEKLVRSLKTSEPNLNGGGDAVLDSDQRHIAKAGQMIFDEPDNSLLGLGSAKNDYSNVSQMRLMVDDSYTQKLTDQVRSLLGEEQKASRTSYFQNQNALVLGGGMPLTANIYSSNESSLNPERYYKMLQATLSAVANVLSVGMVHDKLTNNYDQGQYGVYLRIAVPAGVDPNEFLKTLNLDSSRFAAERII